jgi:hypothetical protein
VVDRHHAIGGAQKRGEAEIDQVDAGDAERDIAGRHDAFVQYVIEEVEQAPFRLVEDAIGKGRTLGRMFCRHGSQSRKL